MIIRSFDIEGLLLIEPDIFTDSRGYFLETFNRKHFRLETGLDLEFVQDNESLSQRGVLRGLHFQNAPHAQGKLVRVVRGKVLDVAVDLRKNSKSYGQHHSVVLCSEKKHQFYIPAGFAHGFSVLTDDTILSYKCTDYYHPESELTLLWNDPALGIDWRIEDPILSQKDRTKGVPLNDLVSSF